MNPSKFNKYFSTLFLLFFFFSISVKIPLYDFLLNSKAQNKEFVNLVSILVNENIYKDIESHLLRYSKDIQSVLENTKVVILPVPSNASPFSIFSLNEALYFEGYKALHDVDFESKLIGTVFVGDIPLATISDNNKTISSIIPYTDFEDKSYIYNNNTGLFDLNNSKENDLLAEIWHGVIAPNSSNNIEDFKNYFDKNHDFYVGEGLFKEDIGIINGKNSFQINDNYEPYVFYFDQFREQASIHLPSYKAYEAYLENREDLSYFRYTKDLASKIKEKISLSEKNEIVGLLNKLGDENFKKDFLSASSLDLSKASDIISRNLINESIKSFVQIFNNGQISDFRTNIHNAGRYNGAGAKVNMDMIPYLISTLDLLSDEIIKKGNTSLEEYIDFVVKAKLASKIIIATKIVDHSYEYGPISLDMDYIPLKNSYGKTYINFLDGKNSQYINSSSECSIYRGSNYSSGQLVEANRGRNINNINLDIQKCNKAETSGLWGGNSPLNLNESLLDNGIFEINNSDINLSVSPLYDVSGSKRVLNNLKTPSFLNCYKYNFLLVEQSTAFGDIYKINFNSDGEPLQGGSINYGCYTDMNSKRFSSSNISTSETYEQVLSSITNNVLSGSLDCGNTGTDLILDGNKIARTKYKYISLLGEESIKECPYVRFDRYFNTINSYVYHKSPTPDELTKQIKTPFTPNLAIDKERYIDFFALDKKYKKIVYPNLFGFFYKDKKKDFSSSKADIELSLNIYLKKLFPNNDNSFSSDDLLNKLKSINSQKISFLGNDKNINFLNLLVFALYWKDLNSTSSKYKFVLENYLSDQFGGNNLDFILAKNKSLYEIAYIGGHGDSQNMHINIDPNLKKENPYSQLYTNNALLDTSILSYKITRPFSTTNKIQSNNAIIYADNNECSPPGGVVLWKWPDAVSCRIKSFYLGKKSNISSYCGAKEEDEDEFENMNDIKRFEEDNQCNADFNKDGINDCLFLKLKNSKIELESTKKKYHYLESFNLKLKLKDKFDKTILIDDYNYANFEIVSIFDKGLSKYVYDVNENKDLKSRYSIINQYIDIRNLSIRLDKGKASNLLVFKNKDAIIKFKANILTKDKYDNEKFFIESNILELEVNGDKLALSSSIIEDGEIDNVGSIAKASKEGNIFLYLSKNNDIYKLKEESKFTEEGALALALSKKSNGGVDLDIDFPLKIKIQDINSKLIDEKKLDSLDSIIPIFSIEKSGTYNLSISDSNGYIIEKELEILASDPFKLDLDLSSNYIEKDGFLSTNIISIYDEFNNLVKSDLFDLHLNLTGNNLLFNENQEDNIKYRTYEGFRTFQVISKNSSGISNLNIDLYKDGNKILNKSVPIKVMDEIVLDIEKDNNFEVGNKSYKLKLKLKDKNGNLLSDLNSKVHLNIDSKYGSTSKEFYDIVAGEAEIEFNTSLIAGKNIAFEFSFLSNKSLYRKYFDILPGKAMKVYLDSSNSKLEASSSAITFLQAELKDIYGNLVFNDSSTILNLELKDEYKDVISPEKFSEKVKDGKASFKIFAKDNPGIAYVKVSTSPNLANNKDYLVGQAILSKDSIKSSLLINSGVLTNIGRNLFYEMEDGNYRFKFNRLEDLLQNKYFKTFNSLLKDELKQIWISSNKIEFSGVGENVYKFESFYFWSKDKIINRKYNSLYTVLLGADYGNFKKKDYLASAMLFERNNRALAVTSLLNDPNHYDDIISIGSNSSIKKIYDSSDLTQNILFNLNFDSNNRPYLDLLNTSNSTNIGNIFFNFDSNNSLVVCDSKNCNLDNTKTNIYLNGLLDSDFKLEKINEDRIVLKNKYNEILLNVEKDGKIFIRQGLSLKFNQDISNFIEFDVLVSDKKVASLGFKFNNADIKISKTKEIFAGLLDSSKNNIIVNLFTKDYSIRESFGVSGEKVYNIYYNDSLNKDGQINSFAKLNPDSFESFAENPNVGWKGGNKSLLEFASGESVGESVKKYTSIGLVNLGDPVISLKKIKKKFIGKDSYRNFDSTIGRKINDKNVEAFFLLDYNGDTRKDIVILEYNNLFRLLENKSIAGQFVNHGNIANIIDLGDSSLIQAGDFTGDGYDDLFFVNNKGDPFLLNNKNKDFTRVSLKEKFGLKGEIKSVKGFDMDNDGKQDLVILDSYGEISIFYGGGSNGDADFVKLIISSGYGISLNSVSRSDLGLIYFDSLENSNLESVSSENSDNLVNEKLIDSLLFVDLSYSKLSDSSSLIDEKIDFLGKNLNSSDLDNANIDQLSSVLKENKEDIQNISSNNTKKLRFIKSEYASSKGLEISRVYNDKNSGYLQANDIVSVELRIKNTSGSKISDIIYLEDIPAEFILENTSNVKNNLGLELKNGLENYKFLFEDFSLNPGEELIINYDLKARSLKYGHIDLGLFEKNELGDDSFGDILLKNSKKNCSSSSYEIFRSISNRKYEKGIKNIECDTSKLKLPNQIEQNKKDENGDGVPDIYEGLDNKDNINNDLKNLLDKSANDLYIDSDSDGIPDNEDRVSFAGDDIDKTFSSKIEDVYDDFSESIDTLMEGFSCGFGGSSCISSPLNRAPLAPGNDPVLLGKLIGDGLKVSEGLPLFSGMTRIGVPKSCYPSFFVFPFFPAGLNSGCKNLGAGGRFGTSNKSNFIRFFWTPTITGGQGTATCFGGPAELYGNTPSKGLSPLLSGGNCIVTASPLSSCSAKNKDINGDPNSIGIASNFRDANFGFINGNCDSSSNNKSKSLSYTNKLDPNFINAYLNYKQTRTISTDFSGLYKNSINNLQTNNNNNYNSSSDFEPLFEFGGSSNNYDLELDMDFSDISEGNFEDVIEFNNTRISPFPAFLMEWANRQLDEIITKLTDFPSVILILPDFSSIFNGDWYDYVSNGLKDVLSETDRRQSNIDDKIKKNIDDLRAKNNSLDCSGKDSYECDMNNNIIKNEEVSIGQTLNNKYSGIRGAYEFLSSVPIVNINSQKIDISIPWINRSVLNKTIDSWNITYLQRKEELNYIKKSWTGGAACSSLESLEEKKRCEDNNAISEKIIIDVSNLVNSLEQNINVLEDYKKLPEKISKLINKKEDYLEQIMCNVEFISNLSSSWIVKNGRIFKSWVETYILVKAILSSWQVLADVFIDYDAECHECKNERHDSLGGQFEIINAIIPQIPIIKFPKWPDIILDLHNIRLNLSINIPEFDINLRPIVIPDLPNLYLPDLPSLSINLPSLPVLEKLEVPELADFPSLSSLKMPELVNLPPAPSLPKLFGSIEGVVDILKFVTKAMCILKKSPFVPEWRAGDQIAFLTERTGKLDFDYLDISLPNFTYPFVDAIKVTTYVNLEFETDFLVEMAKIISFKFNSKTSDINSFLNVDNMDLDFRGYVPNNIDINIDIEKSKNSKDKDNLKTDIDISYKKQTNKFYIPFKDFQIVLNKGISSIYKYLIINKDITITNQDFIKTINKELTSKNIAGDPKFDKLRDIWAGVNKMDLSKEDKEIERLLKLNKEKFGEIKNILALEKLKNRELLKKIQNIDNKAFAINIAQIDDKSDFNEYNASLNKYNKNTADNYIKFRSGDYKDDNIEFKVKGKDIVNDFRKVINPSNNSSDGIKSTITNNKPSNNINFTTTSLLANNSINSLPNINNNILANNNTSTITSNTQNENQCVLSNKSDYKYDYKGLYITEEKGNYLLFDYFDELYGNEIVETLDFDLDNDQDLIYLNNGNLFLKENLTNNLEKKYFDSVIYLSSKDNKFFNSSLIYEAVNNSRENIISNSSINFSFLASNNKNINNYRLEYYSIIDKYLNIGNNLFNPSSINLNIIDAISNEKDVTKFSNLEKKGSIFSFLDKSYSNANNSLFDLRRNIAYISNIGELPGIELKTKKSYLLNDDLENDKLVLIAPSTRVYTKNKSVNIVYFEGEEQKTFEIPKYSNISFNKLTKISSIEGGDIFIFKDKELILTGSKLIEYKNMPLLFGDRIYKKTPGIYTSSSNLDIVYYDESKAYIDFRETDSYELYDLGYNNDEYFIKFYHENDYLYSRIRSFNNNIFSTYSNQVLLSPQLESDKRPPDFLFNSDIKIPVYLSKTIDFSSYISDDSGIIKDIKIEGLDSNTYSIEKISNNIKIKFGAYNNLFTKKIKFILSDIVGNINSKEVNFEVYAPIPNIIKNDNGLISGKLNEILDLEPIDLYRIRGLSISKLKNKNGNDKSLSMTGSFSFDLEQNVSFSGGAVLKKDGNVLLFVDEKTGKVDIQDSSLLLSLAKGEDGFPRISVKDTLGQEVFYESIKIKKQNKINIINDYSDIKSLGLYLKFDKDTQFSSYELPDGLPYDAGTIFIYLSLDDKKEPIFTIFRDGRINSINENYILEYANFDSNIAIILKDKVNNKELGRLIYVLDNFLLIR